MNSPKKKENIFQKIIKKIAKGRQNIPFFIILFILLLIGFINMASSQTSPSLNVNTILFLNYNDVSLFRPLKNNDYYNPNLEANAVLSLLVNIKKDSEKMLYAKDIDQINPLASLTKLMTAVVAIEEYGIDKKINFEPNDLIEITAYGGSINTLKNATVKDLLYIMLIESNNSAANVLASQLPQGEFITLMNKKAKALQMDKTIFYNPSGLDDDNLKNINKSSARDLSKLLVYILNNQPLIPKICSYSELEYYINGKFYKKLENTNLLLENGSDYLWGKTGYTKAANGCIVLVLNPPDLYLVNHQDTYLINIILGASGKNGRFKEAKKLENWLKNSYIW